MDASLLLIRPGSILEETASPVACSFVELTVPARLQGLVSFSRMSCIVFLHSQQHRLDRPTFFDANAFEAKHDKAMRPERLIKPMRAFEGR